MVRAIASLGACVLAAVYGQSADALRFEVTSVKPSNADSRSSSGIYTGHGRLDAQNVSLKRCIMGAYGVGPHQIFGGPDWVESDRFEILAKAEQPINEDAVLMVMLRGLLEERFHLVLHRETRTMPALVLEVAAKGPKLEKAEAGEANTNTSTSNSGISIDARKATMNSFAEILARTADLPVVNHTGLEGVFNLKLHWASESARQDGGAADAASLFTAIQEQLGLRLRSQRTPVEVLVIDHVERPSGN